MKAQRMYTPVAVNARSLDGMLTPQQQRQMAQDAGKRMPRAARTNHKQSLDGMRRHTQAAEIVVVLPVMRRV